MTRFEWDPAKDLENQRRHGVPFATAQFAFADPQRVIAEDLSHSGGERRYYCFGRVGEGGAIRIFGAGYWRKGKRIYEQENPVHK